MFTLDNKQLEAIESAVLVKAREVCRVPDGEYFERFLTIFLIRFVEKCLPKSIGSSEKVNMGRFYKRVNERIGGTAADRPQIDSGLEKYPDRRAWKTFFKKK